MHFNDFKSDRYWTVVVLFALMLVVGGCGGQSKDKNVSPTDSIGETRSSGNMFEALPDTMFESAGRIRYDVEILDSADQTLSSAQSLYDGADVLTFRKTLFRDADFGGRVKGTPATVDTAWVFNTYYNKERLNLVCIRMGQDGR